MKKLLCSGAIALSFFSIIMLQTSCQPQQPETDEPDLAEETVLHYMGATYVHFQGEEYEGDSVRVDFVRNDDGTATLKLFRVRFVPQMPVTVDLDVPSLPYDKKPDAYLFAGDSIVPTMGGNPVDRYMATQIQGTARADSIRFSLNFGSFPTRYAGARIRE